MGPIERGKQAALFLGEFDSLFGPIREDAIQRWIGSPARDTEGREKIYDYVRMIEALRTQLESIRDNGLAAEAADEQRKRDAEFNRRNIGDGE